VAGQALNAKRNFGYKAELLYFTKAHVHCIETKENL